jgi:hypothetical protein
MIDIHVLNGVLVAAALLIGAAVALSLVMLAAARVTGPGRAPHGGIRRDVPPQPQPGTDDARVLVPWQPQPGTDDARVLVPWQPQPDSDDARVLVLR